ncbi:MAG: GNAT family N-acetyltransferase [Bacteroidales bacterium]|nr:GNAT family N-acetyltransferase [Bacteroidales bacterium]
MNKSKIIECDFKNHNHTRALVELMNHYMTDKMGNAKPLDKKQGCSLIEGLRNHPSKLILFAEADEKMVGLANCFINFATFTCKPFINIHDIIVLDEYRKKGIGRKLMHAIQAHAISMGCSKITLEVREDNIHAQHLYKSLGYMDCNPRMFFWEKKLV